MHSPAGFLRTFDMLVPNMCRMERRFRDVDVGPAVKSCFNARLGIYARIESYRQGRGLRPKHNKVSWVVWVARATPHW